ncbi:MAG: NAD+ synthase [Bacillota bacterium]
MRIALAQINPVVGDLKQNTAKLIRCCRKALSGGADLVVFPELAVTGYPPQDLLLYNGFILQVEQIIKEELAPLTAGRAPSILTGTPYRVEGELYNAAVFLENGTVKRVHRKTLLPNYDVFDEKRYFTRSPELAVEMMNDLTVAVTICEDIWNDRDFCPHPLYDLDPVEELVRMNAAVMINLSASPYNQGKQSLREKMVGHLATKHGIALIYLNQVGGNDELIFDGTSLVYNNRGELIYRAASFAEELFFIESDALFSRPKQQVSPIKEDIGTIYRALCLGIKDYLAKTGFCSAVLGLSGGIDSAVTAAIAADALGAENVVGLLMPSPYSSEHSVEDARALAENLGIDYRIMPIEKPFLAFLELFNQDGGPAQDLAEENLQARIRGNQIMFISNREGHLALTTGNKSELAAGYCTLYGDMAGGLAVLADVPKVMVYELAAYLNRLHGKEVIPQRTISKAPSAELRPDQKDEDSLPPYPELDPILNLYIEENLSPAEIIARGHRAETVYQVTALVDRTEYKRRQAAPGLRVTTRAFGSGRRMPIARGYDY